MTALVVYESIYGNTRAIAEAIAEGLRDAGHEGEGRRGGPMPPTRTPTC